MGWSATCLWLCLSWWLRFNTVAFHAPWRLRYGTNINFDERSTWSCSRVVDAASGVEGWHDLGQLLVLNRIAKNPNAFDLNFNCVTMFHPDRRGACCIHARRGPHDDHVTSIQRHAFGEKTMASVADYIMSAVSAFCITRLSRRVTTSSSALPPGNASIVTIQGPNAPGCRSFYPSFIAVSCADSRTTTCHRKRCSGARSPGWLAAWSCR